MAKGKGKKKGPPYDDDPECKYIVIEDPWPGNATGKDRRPVFWDLVGAWVHCMLDKKEYAEAIYSVNTRAEVIVKLAEHVNITPILGAHVWRECFTAGDQRDIKRVSYVFEYNYRTKGEPANHQWLEHFPSTINDQLPVKFPYPPPHWATQNGRNCRDLVLPLPKTRVRTPTPPPPEPSLFEPYQPPAHLPDVRDVEPTADSVEQLSRDEEHEVEVKPEVSPPCCLLFVDKRDPYEEEDAALQFVKQEPSDNASFIHVKLEVPDSRVKEEAFEGLPQREDPAPAQNQPSEAFLAAFQRLQRARAGQAQATTTSPTPDDALISTQLSTADKQSRTETSGPVQAVKPEPQEHVLPVAPASRSPSLPHDPRMRPGSRLAQPQNTRPPPPLAPGRQEISVKPEPHEPALFPPTRVPLAFSRAEEGSNAADTRTRDPRLKNREPAALKRPKKEEDDGFTKRIKTESNYQ